MFLFWPFSMAQSIRDRIRSVVFSSLLLVVFGMFLHIVGIYSGASLFIFSGDVLIIYILYYLWNVGIRMTEISEVLREKRRDFSERFFIDDEDEIADMGHASLALIKKKGEAIDSEREIRRLNEVMTAYMEFANSLIIFVDTEGNILQINAKAKEAFGVDSTLTLSSISSLIDDDEGGAQFQECVRSAMKNRSISREFNLSLPEQSRACIVFSFAGIKEVENVSGVVIVGQDITVMNTAERQLRQTSKLATLGEIATGIAHEINQPLNVVSMAVENTERALNADHLDKDYLKTKLRRIKDQVQRISKITTHMRTFGREDSPHELFEVQESILNVVALLENRLKASSINFSHNIWEEKFYVMGNATQLEQVFLNVIVNSIDSIEENTERLQKKEISVYLSKDLENNIISIEFTDSGLGIKNHIIDRVFDPFLTTKDVGKGTGLGLSVSYGIIASMNGTITAENSGSGAKISIVLPLAPD